MNSQQQAKFVLHGRTVLITGAARGLGRSLALALGRRGARVMAVDIKGDEAEAVAAEVRALGVEAWSFELDVGDIAQIQALHAFVHEHCGRIDVLVNNAGVVFGGTFENIPLEKHLLTYQVNISGLVALTHTFFSDLLAGSDSALVNIASAAGYVGLPFGSTYSSSKWAVLGFAESIRLELAERELNQLSVMTVCPGYINVGQFAGVSRPRLMPFLEADALAERIVQGIEQKESLIREPFLVKAIGLARVLPVPLADWTSRRLGLTRSMSRWRSR